MIEERESGFYFVKPFEKCCDFEVAFWTNFPPCWSCVGTTRLFEDNDFIEIDERRIVREEPATPKITGTMTPTNETDRKFK